MEKTSKQIKDKPFRIVLVGAESTGKSSMVSLLGHYFQTSFSREFLREFAQERYDSGGQLLYNDNFAIIEGQMKLDKIAEESANNLYFADTDALQTITYSQYYYGKHQPELDEILSKQPCDLYLFMDTDIKWEADILRDGEKVRQRIRNLLLNNLNSGKFKFEIISGEGQVRLTNAINSVKKHLNLD